jgi:hypothetical protein
LRDEEEGEILAPTLRKVREEEVDFLLQTLLNVREEEEEGELLAQTLRKVEE